MTVSEIKKEISYLTTNEKLRLVEEIWDTISGNNQELPVSDIQKHQLDERLLEYKSGKVSLYDWKNVHQELRVNNK